MMSNLSDQWTRFKVLVIGGGVFDWMKGKLSGLLDAVDRMAASGKLKELAIDVGARLQHALKISWTAGLALWQVLKRLGAIVNWVAEAVGGYEKLATMLAAVLAIKLVVSIGLLISSVWSLGAALAANPLGLWITGIAIAALLIIKYWAPLKPFFATLWESIVGITAGAMIMLTVGMSAMNPMVAALALLGAAAAMIYKNWEPLKDFFSMLWDGIIATFNTAVDWIGNKVKGLAGLISTVMRVLLPNYAVPAPVTAPNLAAPSKTIPQSSSSYAQSQKNQVGGTIKLEITGAPVKVKAISKANPLIDFDVDTGRMLYSGY
ncbi:MAG: hypothetical protein A2511_03090 [Deltaproteobacteria bacterium RIFOXYD12_FULL_50_9]|nr:MAG: hypothetical protein A2511_03090 [Deltaproteobacteria bacterium RIFOXYD12_FULL_50_9]